MRKALLQARDSPPITSLEVAEVTSKMQHLVHRKEFPRNHIGILLELRIQHEAKDHAARDQALLEKLIFSGYSRIERQI